jgi:hypothetical protein
VPRRVRDSNSRNKNTSPSESREHRRGVLLPIIIAFIYLFRFHTLGNFDGVAKS